MRIAIEGQRAGQFLRLEWEDGQVSGTDDALILFRAWAETWRGRSVRLPEAGSVRCDPSDPWGFYALAVGLFDGPTKLTGDELPPVTEAEEPGPGDGPVIY